MCDILISIVRLRAECTQQYCTPRSCRSTNSFETFHDVARHPTPHDRIDSLFLSVPLPHHRTHASHAAVLVDAEEKTSVDVTYCSAYDTANCGSGGCNCDKTRDKMRAADSRWSCKYDLAGTPCRVCYTFGRPQVSVVVNDAPCMFSHIPVAVYALLTNRTSRCLVVRAPLVNALEMLGALYPTQNTTFTKD